MKKFIIFLTSLSLLSAFYACSEEIQPLYITGSWDAYYFEHVDCSDSLDNIKVDLNLDSSYLIDGKTVKFNSYELEILENGDYTFILSKTIDGNDTVETESGVSLSSGFNDIVFCRAECSDSLLKKGLYVVSGNNLDLSFEDTLDLRCGVVFQAQLRQ